MQRMGLKFSIFWVERIFIITRSFCASLRICCSLTGNTTAVISKRMPKWSASKMQRSVGGSYVPRVRCHLKPELKVSIGQWWNRCFITT